MRLHGYLKKLIKHSLAKIFNNADIIIFGSRVNENKQGGDIDIAIKTNVSSELFTQKKLIFLTELMRKNIDLKIDLIQYSDSMDSLLKKEIQNSSELLISESD